MSSDDERFVRRAIELAARARAAGEDPFGAVLVRAGEIVLEAEDATIALTDPTAHAELGAIRARCRQLGTTSLPDHVLYSNVEPCAMCAGAIHWARIPRIVFSVPQSALQSLTGGRPKPDAAAILRCGRVPMEIVGSLLIDEGLAALRGHAWTSKAARIAKRGGAA